MKTTLRRIFKVFLKFYCLTLCDLATIDGKMIAFWIFFEISPKVVVFICNLKEYGIAWFFIFLYAWLTTKQFQIKAHKAAIYKKPLKKHTGIVPPGP